MADEIDILIDLKGYTTLSRAEILAYRPAPIQVNYLGYPGTMGADFIDYILVDDFVVPTSEQRFYTEHLVYLPGCYQPNDSQQTIAKETPSRAECGLPESGFVFCSFNSSYKLTPALFTIWMRLLRAIPGSVLWLLEANAMATSNLRRQAELQGVDPSRLVFASILALPEHLARHRLADLFLDSFPVNAHTTASDALRMRLPIVTLSGETFASRVAGSLLHALGMPELITRNFDDYESLALRLATNPNELSNLRLKLDAHLQSSRLYDGRFAARRVEKAYSDMWTLYQTQQPPRPIEISSKAQEC